MVDPNINTPQDALRWLERRIREEVKLDGEMTTDHAIELAFIDAMLDRFPENKTARNGDFGTAEEQHQRFVKFCMLHDCPTCPLCLADPRPMLCALAWAQLPCGAGDGDTHPRIEQATRRIKATEPWL